MRKYLRTKISNLAAVLLAAVLAATPAQAQASPEAEDPFGSAAEAAWNYFERNYEEETGLVHATENWAYPTTWDIGSIMAAYYSARKLGLIDEGEYRSRMTRVLETLAEADFFDGVAPNRLYDSRTGAMVTQDGQPTERGSGWSTTDLGRLLIWLKIVAQDPEFAEAAEGVVERMALDRIVRDGYLFGATVLSNGKVEMYPEGRIGYEQYAARGFELWGYEADEALSLDANSKPVTVQGFGLLGDRRGGEKLTSDPFIMMGMELGWTPQFREMAQRLLRAQEARYRDTGQVTVVNEDAMNDRPYYFYYYTVYKDGQEFVVYAHGVERPLRGPRWVSSKGAFGWHALLPSDYTRLALETVEPARDRERGWSSGVYERSGRSTNNFNVNTAAVILEAALYARTGEPFLGTRSPE